MANTRTFFTPLRTWLMNSCAGPASGSRQRAKQRCQPIVWFSFRTPFFGAGMGLGKLFTQLAGRSFPTQSLLTFSPAPALRAGVRFRESSVRAELAPATGCPRL
jgi:hypothetical protein